MRILYNARIYTLDRETPTASALVIDHGRILTLGDDDRILADFRVQATVHNLGGRPVIPGLTDAHIHLKHYALSLKNVDCETPTREECLRRVAERAHTTPPGKWILGHGWNQNEWPEGFGRAVDLDTVAPDNPVYLTAKSLHAAWVNSAALRAAHINANTPDPGGGVIQRDRHGNPAGILIEGAMLLAADVIPEPPLAEVVEAIRGAQSALWSMGVTGGHDFDRQTCFAALQALHAEGDLRLRVIKSIPLEALPQAAELGLRGGFGDDWLRIGSVKAFADGALGPHTAALLQPYENASADRGMLLMRAVELFEHGRLAADNYLPMAVHAIGDRANREVLKAFEQLRDYEQQQAKGGLPEAVGTRLRHRIEHVQLLHPQDVHKLAELGITASMQPIHATSDMLMADEYWGERAALSYVWRTNCGTSAQRRRWWGENG
ncbi:MAG: amidohydrolase [Chloroflexi bacterium]|nr:amidohydrolase [Chloroflexota bacterium]MBU1661588.1 amidohydrolase [Chloroflexota bacterium]